MPNVTAYPLPRSIVALLLAVSLSGASVAAPQAPAPAPAAAQPPAATPLPAEAAAPAQAPVKFRIVYLSKEYEEPPPLSYAEPIITDKGIQGARLSVKEANQSGAFVGRAFDLEEAIVPADGDVVAKAKEVLKAGDALIVADLTAADLLAVADLPEAKNSILMNVRSSDEVLRQEQCRSNVFHVIPDWAMRADAIAQYLIWKKWPRWFVLRGDAPADKDFVAQVQRSAKRYGGKIVEERVYNFPPGARNLDSGHQQVQAQMPMATEGAPEHDVLWVADTNEAFGDYLPYRTYTPRPVVGTQGMQALAWDPSYTEYGAMSFQNAMRKLAKRPPTERDYTGWLGVRILADSVMRSGKTTIPEFKAFLLSEGFALEGFKGLALNFRDWDHQMRQPILLGGGTRTVVSKSPQEGFLHQTNLTDTLGFDRPETKCKFR
jgi:ABC transporter substrate binding protein (PQQ-dependent alcohol dehydrogenase system)